MEDDGFLRHLYELKFVEAGFTVVQAEDGEQALEVIRERKPAAVLLDVELPKLSGIEVLRRLKADKATQAIPVVMLTNSSSVESIQGARAAGAADYLIKAHFLPSEVVTKVISYLS